MLTNKQSILQLASLMSAHGVKNVIVCPGSRNAPIIHTLATCGIYTVHPVTDERSAGFQAIGMALATHQPTAVCVTSGSALLNLHPAIAEAYYQHVPLVIISADRPDAWIGQMDGQTLPQPHVFGTLVKASANLPEGDDEQSVWHANRLINEALLAATDGEGYPVHINVPLSNPIYDFTTESLPKVRIIKRLDINNQADVQRLIGSSKHRWLIIGQNREPLPETLLTPLSQYFHIFAEHLSNCTSQSCVTTLTDDLMQAGTRTEMPDLVITIGGHIICKTLKEILRTSHPLQHWHVSQEGDVADLFCCLTTIVRSNTCDFLEKMLFNAVNSNLPHKNDTSFVKTKETEQTTNSPSLQAMHKLSEQLFVLTSRRVALHLANSTSVRNAQLVHFPSHVTICCNRGVNGIEGSLSTAVGYAQAQPDTLNIVVIGDLSFFYDSNALWHNTLPSNLRILLINNGGGEIFNHLPVPTLEVSRNSIRGTNHTEAHHLCKHYGITHHSTTGPSELQTLLHDFFTIETPQLIELKA